jgi:hypothetical protein
MLSDRVNDSDADSDELLLSESEGEKETDADSEGEGETLPEWLTVVEAESLCVIDCERDSEIDGVAETELLLV